MSKNQKCDVVVTGLGAVTPLAHNIAELWPALLRGADAISDLDRFDTGGIACTRAGLVRGYRPPPTATRLDFICSSLPASRTTAR